MWFSEDQCLGLNMVIGLLSVANVSSGSTSSFPSLQFNTWPGWLWSHFAPVGRLCASLFWLSQRTTIFSFPRSKQCQNRSGFTRCHLSCFSPFLFTTFRRQWGEGGGLRSPDWLIPQMLTSEHINIELFAFPVPFPLSGDSFGPSGLGQRQWNANPCRSLPQGSLRDLRDTLLAQDQTGVCVCVWRVKGWCNVLLSYFMLFVSLDFLPSQGESFREVMRRIQTMLDIQEKEFEKVRHCKIMLHYLYQLQLLCPDEYLLFCWPVGVDDAITTALSSVWCYMLELNMTTTSEYLSYVLLANVCFPCVFAFSSSLRLWWWGDISTSPKTSTRSTWRTLNHSQVFPAVMYIFQLSHHSWWSSSTAQHCSGLWS